MKKSEFKVMPWLRGIREKHARKVAGLSPAEIIAESKKRKKVKPLSYMEVRPPEERNLHSVAETKSRYGRRGKGGS